jgi:hypothetical protein
MGQLVADLPTWPVDDMGDLYVKYNDDAEHTEGNVITVAQVREANDKGWNVWCENAEGTAWEPYAGSDFVLGDVNGDRNVSIADVTALITYLMSGGSGNIDVDAADVNGSGSVTIADVTTLINYLMNGTWPARVRAPRASSSGIDLMFDEPVVLECWRDRLPKHM